MQPDKDTLFVEGFGFGSEEVSFEWPMPEVSGGPESSPVIKALGATSKVVNRAWLEAARQNYQITAWEYAARLAHLEGIRIVPADLNAFELQLSQTLAGGKTIPELAQSPNEEDRRLLEQIYERRVRSAAKIVKDYALLHLPAKDAPVPTGRRSKLKLLFGANHAEELRKMFIHNFDLRAWVFTMEETDLRNRVAEQLSRLNNSGGFDDFYKNL